MAETNHKHRYPGDLHDHPSEGARREEDPLVELARIVSGGSFFPDPEEDSPEAADSRSGAVDRSDAAAPLDEGVPGGQGFDDEARYAEPAFADDFPVDEVPADGNPDVESVTDAGEDYDAWDRPLGEVNAALDEPSDSGFPDVDPMEALERELLGELDEQLSARAPDADVIEPSIETDAGLDAGSEVAVESGSAPEPQKPAAPLSFVPVWDEEEPANAMLPAVDPSESSPGDLPAADEPSADRDAALEADLSTPDESDVSLSALAASLDPSRYEAGASIVERLANNVSGGDAGFTLNNRVSYEPVPPASNGSTMDLYERIRASSFGDEGAGEADDIDEAEEAGDEIGVDETPVAEGLVAEESPIDDAGDEIPIDAPDVARSAGDETDSEAMDDAIAAAFDDEPVSPAPAVGSEVIGGDEAASLRQPAFAIGAEDAGAEDAVASFDLSAYSSAYAMTAPAAAAAAGMAVASPPPPRSRSTAFPIETTGMSRFEAERMESPQPEKPAAAFAEPAGDAEPPVRAFVADEEVPAGDEVQAEAGAPGVEAAPVEEIEDPEDLLENLLASELASDAFLREPARRVTPAETAPRDVEPAAFDRFDAPEPSMPAFDSDARTSDDEFERALADDLTPRDGMLDDAFGDRSGFDARDYRDETEEGVDTQARPVDLDEVYGRTSGGADSYAADEIALAASEAAPTYSDEEALPPKDEEDVAASPAGEASRRGVWAMAAIGAVVLVGIGGFLGYRILAGPEDSGPPPVIQASTEPVKVVPEKPADSGDADARGKLIYDRVGDAGNERLIVPGNEDVVPLDGATSGPRVVGTENQNADGEALPGVPRRVRTVVVRPDGTIISGEPDAESTEPATPESSEGLRPTTSDVASAAPAVDAAADDGVDPLAGDAVASGDPSEVRPLEKPGEDGAAEATPTADAADTLSAPVLPPVPPSGEDRRVATQSFSAQPVEIGANAPVPVNRPGDVTTAQSAPARTATATRQPAAAEERIRPVSPTVPGTGQGRPMALVPAGGTQTAAASPTSQAQPAQATSGDYVVQVTSQRSESQAQIAYRSLQSRYSDLLGSRSPNIERADLGDKGTYYRVRVGPMSRDDANTLCGGLKARGGDCFVRRR